MSPLYVDCFLHYCFIAYFIHNRLIENIGLRSLSEFWTSLSVEPSFSSKSDPGRGIMLGPRGCGLSGGLFLLGLPAYDRTRNRTLSLPVSTMWQWWVRRSRSAVVLLAPSEGLNGEQASANMQVGALDDALAIQGRRQVTDHDGQVPDRRDSQTVRPLRSNWVKARRRMDV